MPAPGWMPLAIEFARPRGNARVAQVEAGLRDRFEC